jgi:hypothetical protein
MARAAGYLISIGLGTSQTKNDEKTDSSKIGKTSGENLPMDYWYPEIGFVSSAPH